MGEPFDDLDELEFETESPLLGRPVAARDPAYVRHLAVPHGPAAGGSDMPALHQKRAHLGALVDNSNSTAMRPMSDKPFGAFPDSSMGSKAPGALAGSQTLMPPPPPRPPLSMQQPQQRGPGIPSLPPSSQQLSFHHQQQQQQQEQQQAWQPSPSGNPWERSMQQQQQQGAIPGLFGNPRPNLNPATTTALAPGLAGPPPSSIAAQLRPGPFPRVPRMLPGPAGKLQSLQAAGRLESATPEALGLSIGSGQEDAQAGDSGRDALFVSATWRAALAYSGGQGGVLGNQPQGPITTVKAARGSGPCKLARMLVMVVDLKPSGGRGAFAKIKDPSGSMGAAVHQSLVEREPALAPGAALLLADVAVFTPLLGLTYLCLVPQNVLKVFPAMGPGAAPPLLHPADASYTQVMIPPFQRPPPTQQHQQQWHPNQPSPPQQQQQQHQRQQLQPQQRLWPAGPGTRQQAPVTPADSGASAPAWLPPPSPGLDPASPLFRNAGRMGGGGAQGGASLRGAEEAAFEGPADAGGNGSGGSAVGMAQVQQGAAPTQPQVQRGGLAAANGAGGGGTVFRRIRGGGGAAAGQGAAAAAATAAAAAAAAGGSSSAAGQSSSSSLGIPRMAGLFAPPVVAGHGRALGPLGAPGSGAHPSGQQQQQNPQGQTQGLHHSQGQAQQQQQQQSSGGHAGGKSVLGHGGTGGGVDMEMAVAEEEDDGDFVAAIFGSQVVRPQRPQEHGANSIQQQQQQQQEELHGRASGQGHRPGLEGMQPRKRFRAAVPRGAGAPQQQQQQQQQHKQQDGAGRLLGWPTRPPAAHTASQQHSNSMAVPAGQQAHSRIDALLERQEELDELEVD